MLHHFFRTPSAATLILSLVFADFLSSSALALSRFRRPAKTQQVHHGLPKGLEAHHDTLIELENLRKKKLSRGGLTEDEVARRQELKSSLPGYVKRYDDEPGVYSATLKGWSNQYKKITAPVKEAKSPAPRRQQEPGDDGQDNQPAPTQKRWWKSGTPAKEEEPISAKAPQPLPQAYPPIPAYGAYAAYPPPPHPVYLDAYGRPMYPQPLLPPQPSMLQKIKGISTTIGGLGALGGTAGGVAKSQESSGGDSSSTQSSQPQQDPGATASGQSTPDQSGESEEQQPQFYEDANGNWVNQYGQIVDQSGNPIPQ